MKRGCSRERSGPAPRRVPVPVPVRFRDVIELTKGEVFDACGRIALAHQALIRLGEPRTATELVFVFDLMERRVAG